MAHHHHTIADDGTRIAWSRHGDLAAEPVVLVHGIAESARSFDPVTRRLAGDHQVVTMDLRGHGESGHADRYDLAAMAGDVVAVIAAAGIGEPHLVGHSLGGAVVSAVGADAPVASVVAIDQSLELAGFKQQLAAAESTLRDPDAYEGVLSAMFEMMSGDRLPRGERERIAALRRADQEVVLGVWDVILSQSIDEITRTVDAALAGYATHPTPYLALFGIDPGPGYDAWLGQRLPGAVVEVWDGHGHYPHLVAPDAFVQRVRQFWSAAANTPG